MNSRFKFIIAIFGLLAPGCGRFVYNTVICGLGIGEDDNDAFQKSALKSLETIGDNVKAQKTKMDELVSNYDRLDKDTKKACEELTAVKNNVNSTFEEFGKKLKAFQDRIRVEAKAAFGSPIARISGNEELRTRFNCAIRLAMDNQGDMAKKVAPMMKALGEDSSPGSTLINDALLNEIYDSLASYGIWNTFAVKRLGTKTTKMSVKTVRPIAKWILTEGGTISDDTNKAGTQVSLTVEVLAILLNVSLQLLDDAEFDVTADVLDDFSEAYAFALDKATLTNDGTSPDADNGGFTGAFLTATAAAAASGNVSVETLDLEDFIKCITTVDVGVLNRPCKWWTHPQMLARMLSIKDGNGRPIFQTALETPTLGGIGSILGFPVLLANAAPNTDSTSSKVALFGDPSAHVVGIRRDFGFEASDQFRWNTLERSFRGWGRAGVKTRKASALAVLTTAAS